MVAEERLLEGAIGRIRDVEVGPDGYLYLLTDERDGGLYRLEPAAGASRRGLAGLGTTARYRLAGCSDCPGQVCTRRRGTSRSSIGQCSRAAIRPSAIDSHQITS